MSNVIPIDNAVSLKEQVESYQNPTKEQLEEWARTDVNSDEFDNELKKGCTEQYANLRTVRFKLKDLKDFKAPKVERDKVKGDVTWPEDGHTLADYQKRLNKFGSDHFVDATVKFASTASQIRVNTGGMRDSVAELLEYLDEYDTLEKSGGLTDEKKDELFDDFRYILISLVADSKAGIETCASTQAYVVSLSDQVTGFHKDVAPLKQAYASVVEQLKAQFKGGEETMQRKLDQLQKQLRDIQHSINEREKRMIGAGAALGPAYALGLLSGIGFTIWLAVEGGLLDKEKKALAKIEAEAAQVDAAVTFKKFVEQDIDTCLTDVAGTLQALDGALQAVGQDFGKILRLFMGIDSDANKNLKYIRRLLKPRRRHFEKMQKTFDEIERITDRYITGSLKTVIEDKKVGDISAIKTAEEKAA